MDLGEAALIELGDTDEACSCLRQLLALGDVADSKDLKTAQKHLESLPAE